MPPPSYIWNQQPLATGARSKVPYDKKLEQMLTFLSTDGTPVRLAERKGDHLIIPRAVSPIGKVDLRSKGHAIVQSIAHPPRNEEQAWIISESVKLLQDDKDHIIEAPTGFGKTYLATSIAAKLGVTTLIVVPKQDLMTSWFNTLRDLIGVNPNDIGRIQQDCCDFQGKKFVLGMLKSLSIEDRYEEYPDLLRYFGLVIFDEVHRLGADGFSTVCHLFPSRHRLGLSATPDRWDGKQAVFRAHIGPVALRGTSVPMKPKVLVKPTGWTTPKGWVKDEETGQWKKGAIKVVPGKMMGVFKLAAESKERNALIAEFVLSAYRHGRRVVVMSDLIDDHLRVLFHVFAQAGIPGQDMDYYIGGRKPIELEVAKTKPVVLATFAMCAEGTDVPEWDTLVLGVPRSNVKQAIGRVMRSKPGKKQPVILDLLDNGTIYQNLYHSRERQYYQVGAEIIRMAA